MPSTEPNMRPELMTPRPRPEPRSRVGHLTNWATQAFFHCPSLIRFVFYCWLVWVLFFFKAISAHNVELKFMTLRSRVICSTDWANQGVVGVLYIFWILRYLQIYDLQITSPIHWDALSFWWFPLIRRSFLVWCSTICLFLLSLPLPLASDPQHITKSYVETAAYVFFKEFYDFRSYIQIFNPFWVNFYVWCKIMV